MSKWGHTTATLNTRHSVDRKKPDSVPGQHVRADAFKMKEGGMGIKIDASYMYLYAYVHAYANIHTYIHTHMRCIHKYIHTLTHVCTYACRHAYIYA